MSAVQKYMKVVPRKSHNRYAIPLPLDDPAGLGPGIAAAYQCSVRGHLDSSINPYIHFIPIVPLPAAGHASDAIYDLYSWATKITELVRIFKIRLDTMGEMRNYWTDRADLSPWKTDKVPEAPPRVYAFDPAVMKRVEELEAEVARLRRVVAELGGGSADDVSAECYPPIE